MGGGMKPELTFAEFCKLPFQYKMGMSFDWGAHRVHRNDEHGLQMEYVTKRQRHGDIYSGWQEQETTYFLDGDERQFDTPDQLYVAYMEQVCGVKS